LIKSKIEIKSTKAARNKRIIYNKYSIFEMIQKSSNK